VTVMVFLTAIHSFQQRNLQIHAAILVIVDSKVGSILASMKALGLNPSLIRADSAYQDRLALGPKMNADRRLSK